MTQRVGMTVLAGLLAAGAAAVDGGQTGLALGRPFTCSNATLSGTYGIQMQGTRPGPGGVVEAVIGVVIRTYDGVGSFTQVDNIKGSSTGIVPDREGFGTYQVNADCSGITQFQPGPGIVIEERIVVVDGGREVRSITATPLPLMVSSIQQRVDRRHP